MNGKLILAAFALAVTATAHATSNNSNNSPDTTSNSTSAAQAVSGSTSASSAQSTSGALALSASEQTQVGIQSTAVKTGDVTAKGGQGGDANSLSLSQGGDAKSASFSSGGNALSVSESGDSFAEGGNASSEGGDARSNQNVTVEGDVTNNPSNIKLRTVGVAVAPAMAPTAPCLVGVSAGVGVIGFSASGGSYKEDKECTLRETARSFTALGAEETAFQVLCYSEAIKRTIGKKACIEQAQGIAADRAEIHALRQENADLSSAVVDAQERVRRAELSVFGKK